MEDRRLRRIVAKPLVALLILLTCVMGLATDAVAAGGYLLSIAGGTGSAGSPVAGPVTTSPLGQPSAMATDGAGTTWIFLGTGCRVVKVTSGTLSVVAGTGTCGSYAAGPATSSPLSSSVKSLAVDSGGNLYIGDNGAARVLKVTPGGTLSVFAGTGGTGAPVAGPALSSPIQADSMAIDGTGNVYVSWVARAYVLRITAGGTLAVFAGTGTAGATTTGLLTGLTALNQPVSVAVDASGNVYIGDAGNRRIYRIAVLGLTIASFAGNGTSGTPVPGSATSPVPTPSAMAIDSAGTVFVSETTSHQILSFTTAGGAPTLVAGTGGTGTPVAGAATASPLGATLALAAPAADSLLVGDRTGNYLLRIAAPTVPDAPAGLSATPANTAATLTFTAPADGGSAITGYQVSTDGLTWSTLATTGTTTRTGTVSGLLNGVEYTVRVRAVNAVGTSAASTGTTVTPATVPGAPTLAVATGGDASITMAYVAPLNNGGSAVTAYQTSIDAGATWSTLAANGTITGLTNGTAYTVLIRAVNAVGPGPAAAGTTATPRGAPTAPAGLSAAAGNRQATLTFTTPDDGGYPILGYQVSTDDGTTWAALTTTTSGTTNTATVTGLDNGTAYPVRVRALNLGGNGAASAATTVTPPVVPADAPTGLVAVAGSTTVALSFADPANTGGPVTGYEVSTDNGSTWSPLTVTNNLLARAATVTGLVNGTTYAIRVRVLNAAGPGAAAAAVSATPRGVPYAPTGLSAVPGDRQATLTFTTPNDGGNALLGYQVSTDNGASWALLAVTTSGTTNTGTVTGLVNGTTYVVRVRAANLAGTGAASTPASVALPAMVPDAPTGLVAIAGSTTAALGFADPANTGGPPILGYQVSTDDGVTWAGLTVGGNLLGRTATVTGLTNGTTYAIRVRALNAAGPGAASTSVSVTPRGVPYAPTGLSAVAGDRQATLTFTTPNDGGNALLGYQVSTDNGATWALLGVMTSGTTNTATVTGLVNGNAYTVRVRAANLAGTGAASPSVVVTLPSLPPDAPTGLVVTTGDATATVNFADPLATGGSPITGYEVSTDDGTTWSSIAVTGTLVRSGTVTGLTNGSTYAVRVRAVNDAGKGAATGSVAATPRAAPYAPANLTATGGDRQATLTFTTPGDGGYPILGYQASIDNGTTWTGLSVTTSGTTNTGTVTGLANATAYVVRVRALNLAGAGTSSASATATLPALAPGAPTGLMALAGDTTAALSFADPASTGGSPITSYDVSLDDGSTWAPITVGGNAFVRTATVTGLTNGVTYPIRVRAVTAVGAGAASAPASATPRGAPNAPAGLTVVPGNGQAVLTFTTPGDGGYPILGYQASTDNGATWAALTVSTTGTSNNGTVTGLTNGTAYAVRVRAVNVAGNGVATAAVAVTPATVPGAPTAVSATAGNTQATVTFTPPASTGGSPVTGYQVSTDDGATWAALAANGIVTGLTNGTTYTVRVRALNAIGAGAAGASTTVTPIPATPDPPTDLSAVRGDRSATLTFTPPVMTGTSPISGYEVSTDDGLTWRPLAGDGVVTGLTNGTTYAVRVRAVNASGPGPATASVPVTPATVPGVPGPLSVAAGDSRAVLTFAAPAGTGGDPVTGYEVSTDDGTTWTALAPDRTVTGLTNGTTYRFRVRAVNGIGTGPATAGVDATPATLPGVPTDVTATPGDARAVVSFTAPADGGAPITRYEVSTDDGTTWTTLAPDRTVTGLTNATTYAVRVRAVNRTGSGPASAAVPVTPDDGLPGAPTGLSATRADRGTHLTFTAPARPGSSAITGYQVSTDGGASWAPLAGDRSVTGLTNGTTYAVQVRAVNGTGAGPATASVAVTPATVPGTPTGLVVTRGDARATLTFVAPADDGGDPVTGYDVSADDGATWAVLAADRTVTGLTNGTTYRFRVRAVNTVGAGAPTARVDATPATTAGAPTGLTAARGDASATLAFTAPASDGGDLVTGYDVSTDDGLTWAALAGNRVVTGLANGVTYTVRVRAVNSAGPGAASASALVTPATTPGAPTALSASAGDAQAVLMFTAPGDGGDAITSYQVSTDDGATWSALAVTGSGTALTGTVSGLDDGTTYTVRVRARNSVGPGPASASVPVTPVSGLPGAPTGLAATRGDRSVTLSWSPPADEGGSPVTSYDVSVDGGATWTALGPDRVVGGLTNGTAYTFWVRARNDAGPGPASGSATATPATVPGPVSGLAAQAGDRSATVTFNPPADEGGDPVTGFEVSTDDGATWDTLAADGRVTGLVNGTTYRVRVRAVNGAGLGAAGAAVPVTPVSGLPGAPTGLVADRADRGARLTFTAPADAGAGAISSYDVSTDDGATWAPLAADRTVTGLSNGTAYTIRVRARNNAGPGPASAGATVVPAAAPGAPGPVSAMAGDSCATLAFTPPSDNGGSTVTGYQVSTDDGTTWAALTVSGTSILSGMVTGLSNGTAYVIRVRAVNAAGGGAATGGVTVTPAGVPGAPTALNASAGDGEAVLVFTAPASDGGDPITGYQVSTDDGATWATLAADRTVTGLTNGTTYRVRVRAVNAAGPGAAGDSATVTPTDGLPGAPTALSAVRGDSSATLTFTPPAAGPVTGYEFSGDDGWNWAPLAADRRIVALTNGTTYVVRVRAVNNRGSGPAGASTTVTPAGLPGSPRGLAAAAGDTTATLSFTAPAADGGSPISSYDVSTDDGATWAALAADRVVTGLTNGTAYPVRVRAVNDVGAGPASAAVPVTPATTAGAPTNVAVVAGDASVTVTYTAPGDGGAPIRSYEVSTDDGATWATLPTNGVVTGLTNGTTYRVRVRALNDAGPGPASDAVPVTPARTAGAPTNLTATPGDASAALTFTAPGNGGAAITSYEVSVDDGTTWATLAGNRIVTGLANGDTYTVRVRARNSVGAGPASTSVPVTPRTVPGAPAGLTAAPGDASIVVSFTAPGDGGSAITSYEVSTDDGATWATLAANRTVTGLSNGTAYVVRVRARNAAGTGPASASATASPVSGLPGAPSGLVVTRGDASAAISFDAGSGPVTGYQVSTDDGVNYAALPADRVVRGLTNGTSYVIRVRAVNNAGVSPPTAGVTVTPATTATAPAGLSATPGDRRVTVAFTAPASDGGAPVTSYDVSTDNGTTWAALAADRVVTGLSNGTAYPIRVRARNAVGAGAASAAVTATPAAVPGAPTALSAERGDRSATLTFTAPGSDGGTAITGYEVSTDNGTTWTALAADRIVTGLTNGTPYPIRVRARTSAGTGPASTAVTVTPATLPGAPTALTAERGDRSATLTFTDPADNGGAAITLFEASVNDGATWTTLAADRTVTGLSNGTTYTVRVRARNGVGAGAASGSVQVTPAAVPGAPTAVTVTRGDRSATVAFTAPAGDGGSPVLGYDVSLDNGATWAELAANRTVAGLANGTTYAVRVRARNAVGAGPGSLRADVTPATVPAAPADLSATPGDALVAVSFTAPDSGGDPITGYQVSTDDGVTWAALPGDRVVRGLSNGTAYTVRVRALNGVGTGATSASSTVTPVDGLPPIPGDVSVTRGDSSVTVRFTPVSGPVTGYEVTTDGGTTWAALPADGTVTGLTNGVSYAVRVRAVNATGPGPASAAVTVTPATTPARPAALSAVRGDRRATLTLTAGDDGGSAITGYEVSTDNGATWRELPADRVVTGLDNGTTYTVSVRAVNAVGTGPARSTTVVPATVPGAPAQVTAVPGNASATLTVTPGDTGGSPITGYEVSADDGVTWAVLAADRVVTGLVNGTVYRIRVRALNAVGTGAASAATTVTPRTTPGAPVVSAEAGNASATLTVTPGPDGGAAITSYEVSADDGATWTALAAGRVVTGLANGTAYRIRVRARNAAGAGAASAATTVTPRAGLPAAPTGLTVVRGNGSITATFTAGAGDPSGYEITLDGGTTWSVLPAGGVVTGLINGTEYRVAVRAVNTAGSGPATGVVTVTPATTPQAPVVQNVVFSGTTATVTFTAPAADGGAAITGYDASVDGGATWTAVTITGTGPFTATLTGLTAGTTYAVLLRARNAAGPGPASEEYSIGVPSAPTGVAVSRTGTTATVTFTPPDDDTVTGYEVSLDDGVTWATLPTGGALTGLDATRTYVVRVRAVNAAGPGRSSVAVTSSPLDPAAPRSVTVTAGTSSILVTWAPPTGSAVPVTGYRVVADPGPATCTVGPAVTSCRLGATAGISYTVRVVALAAGDRSASSAASSPVTPLAPVVPTSPPASAPSLTTNLGDITTAEPGERFELVGTGFAPYSTVTLVIYSTPRPLGTVIAGADGTFRKLVEVPADLPAGEHTFLATGVDPDGNVLTRTLSVTVAAAVSPSPSTSPSPVTSPTTAPTDDGDDDGPLGMPTTGANVALVAAAGLLLVGVGAALLFVRRRPRR
ncbi:fibronectin type III domain-containing protein [Actinoplanes sp. NPDC051494]|uniref:fibronectin type III domain-containing protein n=1 Tax=Actinoplanes sp. NPDC051494 TaxID=3363907 RepID=UPI0037AA56F9